MYDKAGTIRVMVADDHTLFRAGVVNLLADEPDITVVAEVSNGFDAIKMAQEKKPEVILMDLEMPYQDGMEAMVAIKQALPNVKIVIFTGYANESDLFHSLKLGADGCILKTEPEDEVIEAIRKVSRDVPAISDQVATILINDLRENNIHAPELSEREIEILNLTGNGLSPREISRQLLISESTARTYLKRLMQKLHLYTRDEVVNYAIRHALRGQN